MNLATYLQRVARANPELPAVAHGGALIHSYAGLAERTARLAGALRGRLELPAGARVAVIAENNPCYPELLYACWWAGLLAVPINARLHADEFSYILDHSGAALAFASQRLGESVAPGAASCGARLVEIGGVEYTDLLHADPLPLQALRGETPAWLFYTSGTTGRPKGAVLSHANLLSMALSYFADVESVAPGDAIIHASPMSHGTGIYSVPHVLAGALQVIPDGGGFNPDEIAALLGHWPNCTLFAAPTAVMRLASSISHRPRGLKTLVYGGGPMYAADAERAQAAFSDALVQIYGQGESPMTITCLRRADIADLHHPSWRERVASVGRAHSVVEVEVVDKGGETLPTGEIGEVVVRGPTLMRGYWRDEPSTRNALRDGWLYTGDMGQFSEDGYLTLKDRSKDVIISGGMNIYPREVEEVLLTHPCIAEVSVIGRHSDEWGESVVAYLVCRERPAPDAGELDALCLGHLARFKRPRNYVFVDALPKNNNGKVLKNALRARDRRRQRAESPVG